MAAIIDYRGVTPKKTSFGIPLITAKIVKGGRIERPEEFVAVEDYDEWMRRGLPQAGDVVMTTEAPLGEIAQLTDEKVALAQRIITLRGKAGLLDNTFLKFLMQSQYVQEQLKSRSTGTTVLGIKQSELRKIDLVIPPISEQRAIARILGALDDKIELNRRMNQTLETMARAIFKSWFVDFDPVRAKAEGRKPDGMDAETAALFTDAFEDSALGKIPKGWEVITVADFAEIVGGSTPRTNESSYWNQGEHHWVTPKDLSKLAVPVLLTTERKITAEGLSQVSSGLLPVGAILLSSRAPIGYLAISEIPVAVNQGFIAMKPKDGVSNLFLLFWAQQAHDEITSRANGSTFLEISKSNFRPLTLIGPEQNVMQTFDQTVRPMYERIVANERQSQTLTTLRDSLLPKLLSGEVRVHTGQR